MFLQYSIHLKWQIRHVLMYCPPGNPLFSKCLALCHCSMQQLCFPTLADCVLFAAVQPDWPWRWSAFPERCAPCAAPSAPRRTGCITDTWCCSTHAGTCHVGTLWCPTDTQSLSPGVRHHQSPDRPGMSTQVTPSPVPCHSPGTTPVPVCLVMMVLCAI